MKEIDNLRAAVSALSRRLIFGHPRQIVAVNFICSVMDCVAAIEHCEHEGGECSGKGKVDCTCDCGHEHRRECEACSGTGIDLDTCEQCFAPYSEVVIREAESYIQRPWTLFEKRKAA